ncbi:MAG TPA: glycosyltransferase family 1 protein [Candidatus Saccharimonadia bacterium]
MKIFVEGTPLFLQRTGVGQYTKNLMDVLLKLDERNHYTIFGFLFIGKRFTNKPIPEGPKLSYKLVRYLPSKIFNAVVRRLFLPPLDLLALSKPDIFFFPNFVRYPLIFGAKSIVVIYDLSYIVQAQFSASPNRKYLTRYVPDSVKKADHVITISQNSKKEIMEHYGVPSQKITIVTPAINHQIFFPRPDKEVEAIRQKYDISKPYILYAGTLEPRKNIIGILDAFAELDAGLLQTHALVLAGGKGWLDHEIHAKIKELSELDIIVTGYLPDEDLPAIYSGASLFVYPSFYEGFGIPPLEAMACGVPVITSDNSSLPEVVGDAGIMIDAHSTPALTRSMQKVLTDPGLVKQLRGRGLKQAKRFNWEQSGKILLEVINTIGRA